jgi:hypothetical protein
MERMSAGRWGFVAVAVVIGVLAALVQNWWTVTAMVLVVVGQVLAARRASAVGAAPGSAEPPRR